MKMLSQAASLLRNLFRRRERDADLDAEVRSYVELLAEEKMRAGASPECARREARLEAGGMEQVKQQIRESRAGAWLDTLLQDVRYALHQLRRSPGFATVAILTLALGIGANTAIFSLIDAVMFRTLPVRSPHQLVLLSWHAKHPPALHSYSTSGDCPDISFRTGADCWFSYPLFQQIHSGQKSFASVFGTLDTGAMDLSFHGNVSRAQGTFVSGDFFAGMAAPAALGRTLQPADDSLGAAPAITLAYDYWKRQFGGDPSIVGKTIYLNRLPFSVTGIAAHGFFGFDATAPADFWVPLSYRPALAPTYPAMTDFATEWLRIEARVKPGLTIAQAEAMADPVYIRSVTHGPGAIFKSDDAPHLRLVSIARGLNSAREDYSRSLLQLMVLVGIVLLLACANVAGLALARSSARQKEMAVRLALGAGRWRLIRQLLTESLLLASAGGTLGILLAYWAAGFVVSFLSVSSVSRLQIDTRPNLRVLAFTIAVSFAAGILSGLVPAIRATRVELSPALKEGASPFSSPAKRRWLNSANVLVVGQVAISILVLGGAGLLVRSLVNRESIRLGFDQKNLLTFQVDTTLSGLKDADAANLYRDLQRQFGLLPNVASVTYSAVPPLSNWHSVGLFQVPGAASPRKHPFFEKMPVGEKFLATMGIPLIAGRPFMSADFPSDASRQPVIANEELVRKNFGSENPLGRLVSIMGADGEWQIVGVAADASFDSLSLQTQPTLFFPLRTGPAFFEIRSVRNPDILIPLIRGTVRQANPDLLLTDVTTLTDKVGRLLYEERLTAALYSLFGLLALLLACIGLYGLLAYEVARRTREIGIRVALGARQRDLLRLVIGQGLLLAVVGAAIGIAAALGLTRYLAHQLYGVEPTDPVTFAAVTTLLLLVALAACYVPARRALRVDPSSAMRCE